MSFFDDTVSSDQTYERRPTDRSAVVVNVSPEDKKLLDEKFHSGYLDYNVYLPVDFYKHEEQGNIDPAMCFYDGVERYHVYSRKYPQSYTYSELLQARQIELLKSIRNGIIFLLVSRF